MKIIFKRKWTFILLLFFFSSQANSQTFEVSYDFGFSQYFGDLAPYQWKFSLPQESSVTQGVSFGIRFNKYLTWKLGYVNTVLSASDKNAKDSLPRKKRNLDFRTYIQEFGTSLEFNLFFWNKRKIQDLVQPFALIGINYFTFDPTTTFRGQEYHLQPLGTEGQGLASYPERTPYSLGQFNIPLGVGVKVGVTKHIWLGAGIKFRMTFTDYLDDVSNTYVDLEELARVNGHMSAELAYRTDEIAGGGQIPNDLEGQFRGSPFNNDGYLTSFLTLGIKWAKNPRKRKIKKRYKGSCPTNF